MSSTFTKVQKPLPNAKFPCLLAIINKSVADIDSVVAEIDTTVAEFNNPVADIFTGVAIVNYCIADYLIVLQII